MDNSADFQAQAGGFVCFFGLVSVSVFLFVSAVSFFFRFVSVKVSDF